MKIKMACLTLSTVLFSAIPMAVFAMDASPTPFNGFYAGAAIGGSKVDAHTNQNTATDFIITGIPSFNAQRQSSADLTDSSWAGDLNLGYSHVFKQKFFVGVEGIATLQNTKAHHQITQTGTILPGGSSSIDIVTQSKTSAQLTNTWGALLKLGLVFHQTGLVYGLVGPSWGNIKTSSNMMSEMDITAVSPVPFYQFPGSNTIGSHHYKSGWQAGLGVGYAYTNNLVFDLQWIHMDYGNVQGNALKQTTSDFAFPGLLARATDTLGVQLSNRNKISLANDSIMLGLHYYFW